MKVEWWLESLPMASRDFRRPDRGADGSPRSSAQVHLQKGGLAPISPNSVVLLRPVRGLPSAALSRRLKFRDAIGNDLTIRILSGQYWD